MRFRQFLSRGGSYLESAACELRCSIPFWHGGTGYVQRIPNPTRLFGSRFNLALARASVPIVAKN